MLLSQVCVVILMSKMEINIRYQVRILIMAKLERKFLGVHGLYNFVVAKPAKEAFAFSLVTFVTFFHGKLPCVKSDCLVGCSSVIKVYSHDEGG